MGSSVDFGQEFGPIWVHFWRILGGFGMDTDMGGFWEDLGWILEGFLVFKNLSLIGFLFSWIFMLNSISTSKLQ